LNRWWWRRLVFVRFDEETHTTQRRVHVPEFSTYGFSGEWNMWHRKDELIAFRPKSLAVVRNTKSSGGGRETARCLG
jgi:hypothetical protein